MLCSKCNFPELVLKIGNKKELIASCKACPNVQEMDKKHKLTTYIIKNPPENLSDIKHDDRKIDEAGLQQGK